MVEENVVSSDDVAKSKEIKINVDRQLYTAHFRDGVKRIDVMLVEADSPSDADQIVKMHFLYNIIQDGLHVETEPSVMDLHKDLHFIKIHAPDAWLRKHMVDYDEHFYFKNKRKRLISRYLSVMETIFPFSRIFIEREWISKVRNSYGKHTFSTAERSQIIYEYLLNLPFGNGEADIGLSRLLGRKIFLDVYALHDGPYLYLPNEDPKLTYNARQILYDFWARKGRWYKVQPLNLIHEYFGERISLYFAFYGYLNSVLIIAAIVGVVFTFLELFDTTDEIIWVETCNDNETIICPLCPEFDLCPFEQLSQFCMSAKIINTLDNPFTLFYSIFVSLWAVFIIGFWRRYESFWCWMWCLNIGAVENKTRPDYKIDKTKQKMSHLTGTMRPFESRKKRVARIVFTFVIIAVCVFTVFSVIALMILYKYWLRLIFQNESKVAYGKHLVSALYSVVNVIVILVLEHSCTRLSFVLTDFENHRTQQTYDRSLVVKLYAFTFAFTFSMLIYISYIKGSLYTYPSDPSRWYPLSGVMMTTCNPFGCLDDVWILFTTMLVVKQLIVKVILAMLKRVKTDYNQGDEITEQVPCWEREYQLLPVTDVTLVIKYRELVTQFGMVTLFVAAFPLAPLCVLLANAWELRASARIFLLGSRRPLLLKATGLGAWREILIAVAYGSALTNGLTIAFTTKTLQRTLYMQNHTSLAGFTLSTMSKFDVNDYLSVAGPGKEFTNYKGFKPPQYCYYPGYRHPPSSPLKYNVTGDHYMIKFYEIFFVFGYEHAVFLLIFVFHYVIPTVPRELQETIAMENRQIEEMKEAQSNFLRDNNKK